MKRRSVTANRSGSVPSNPLRPLAEPLEARRLLAVDATPLLASYAGDQPDGALDDYIVYVSGGHGFAADGDLWRAGRPETHEMVESFGNQDQLQFYADYLWNAGATIVPLRPVGHQPNEVVLDNDDPEVTYSGSWSNSTSGIYWGQTSDSVSYRFAPVNSVETATATYRPNLPEGGIYPVYTWVLDSGNRTDQLYRVNHSGGSSEVRVDHTKVGKGWVYLGSFHFDAGTAGSVEISNQGSGGNVIADGIRFGNGMGDIDRGSGVSGQTREDEASLYWLEAMVGQGTDFDDLRTIIGNDTDANVGTLSRFAAHMNNAPFGQAVYVGFHSNAGGGRGTLALHNTSSGGATPNQFQWAQLLGQEVNDDLSWLTRNSGDTYEHLWHDRGSSVTYQASFNYGEIRNDRFNGEMDATILEVAYHDNEFDAELMRDPKIRDAVGRATYQGTVRYFNTYGTGDFVTTTMLPAPPQQVAVLTDGDGGIAIDWSPGAVDTSRGSAATGYTVWFDIGADGGFGLPIDISAGQTSLQLSAAQLAAMGLSSDQAVAARITATNAGGQSLPSRVVTAIPAAASAPRVLLVDAFDRLGRTQNIRQTTDLNYDPPANSNGHTFDRVRPQRANSFDYSRAYGRAIEAYGTDLRVDTVPNEQVASGAVDLNDYDLVMWMAGEESTADETFSTTEQSRVASYLSGGGKLFASGAEIGWDLVAQGSASDAEFFRDTFRADYVADDAGSYAVNGAGGTVFGHLSFAFDDGQRIYDVDFPDVLAAATGGTNLLTYGSGGTAGVGYTDGARRVMILGFPFETITTADDRADVMGSVLSVFDVRRPEVIRTAFGFETSHTIEFTFSENVFATLDREDLVLTNLTTGETVSPGGFTFTETIGSPASPGFIARWTYNGILPDGNYLATIPADSVTDAAGNSLAEDATLEFFVLAGDADRDRDVDFFDFLTLRSNYGTSDKLFSDGDFDYDGDVDFFDFLILRGNYGVTLPPPGGGGSLFDDDRD